MELEKENIEIARKLLKNAMAALDEKLRLLPQNEDEITLDQACDIMKNYDLINYLRNIIVNQLVYLKHESTEKGDADKLVGEIKSSVKDDLDKINGFRSVDDYSTGRPLEFSYHKDLKKIQRYFARQLQTELPSEQLHKIKAAVGYGRKEGGDFDGNLNTIKDLFTTSPLIEMLPEKQEENLQSRELLTRTRTILDLSKRKESKLSHTPLDVSLATRSSKTDLDQSKRKETNLSRALLNVSLAAKSLKKGTPDEKFKKEVKKQNENLAIEMLNYSLDSITRMTDTPQSKIKWLNLLITEHKDILENEKTILERINAMIKQEEENDKQNNENIKIRIEKLLTSPANPQTVLQIDTLIKQLSGVSLSQDLKQLSGIKTPKKLRGTSEAKVPKDIEKPSERKESHDLDKTTEPSITKELTKTSESKIPKKQDVVEFDLSSAMKDVYKTSITLYENNLKQQIDELLATDLSPEIKLQRLHVLVSKRSTYGKEIIDTYHRANQQLISEIAAQIIDADRAFFRNISVEAFIEKNDKKPPISNFIAFFIKLSHWAVIYILQNDINCRVLAYEAIVNLIVQCLMSGDFSGAQALLAGLNSSTITRLKLTTGALSPATNKNLTLIQEVFSNAINFKKLRELNETFAGPKVPYFGLYLQDMNYLKENKKDREWSDLDTGVALINKFIEAQHSLSQPEVRNISRDHSFIDHLDDPLYIDDKSYQYSSELILNEGAKYLSNLYEPRDLKLVATVSPALQTQLSSEAIQLPTRVRQVTVPLQGNIQIIRHHDDLICSLDLLQHNNLRSNLQRLNQSEEDRIHTHFQYNDFVEITDEEWQSILIKINSIEGHPDFANAKSDNLNDEQLLFIGRYYKVHVTTEKGLLKFEEFVGQDTVVNGKKSIKYGTGDALDDLYLYKNGKLVKRNLATEHQNKDLAAHLIRLSEKNKQELNEQEKQTILIANIAKSLAEIDNIINVKIRQIILRNFSVEVLYNYVYIIQQKYDQLIALLADDGVENIIKSNLQKEKEKFNAYLQQLLAITTSYSQRNWIQESEQYRRLYGDSFNTAAAQNKAEFKVFILEGDLTPDQLSGYSTTTGSVFNSLSKTLWMTANGGADFHMPGAEKPQHDPNQSSRLLTKESEKNPALMSADDLIYAQALNRYVVADIHDKKSKRTSQKTYIAATSAPQFNDPESWDYHLLIIDPVQNTQDNVQKLMAHAEKLKKPGDIFDQRLGYLRSHRILSHDEVAKDLIEYKKNSRYLPLVNVNGEFILRNSNGSYTASRKMDIDKCVFLDKEAYFKTRVREIAAKLKGYDEWLKSQNKDGIWRAPLSGMDTSIWLGSDFATRINKEDIEPLFYKAYLEVLKNYQFERIKAVEFPIKLAEGNELKESNSQYIAYQEVFSNVTLSNIKITASVGRNYDPGMSLTDFSSFDANLGKGIDADANVRSSLGNDKVSNTTESIIVNAALGAREAGSPWISTELFNPNNWIIQSQDRGRSTAPQFLSYAIDDPLNILEDKFARNKSPGLHDYEIWLVHRNELYKYIKQHKYDEFNRKLREIGLTPEGTKQVIEAIFAELKNNNLNGEKLIDYTTPENQFILSVTFAPMLMSHFEELSKFNENVGMKSAIPVLTAIAPPTDLAMLDFIEKAIRKYPGLYEKHDREKIIEAMNNFITDLHASKLSNKDKFIICEKMFNVIKQNQLLDANGKPILNSSQKPIAIYDWDEKEHSSLLASHLPKDRKLLLKKQIDLIDLLKEASVVIVTNAAEGNASPDEWKKITEMVEKDDSVVNFHNSNTPVSISETGTRKRIDDVISDSTSELIATVNLMIQEEMSGNVDKMNELVKKYFGKSQLGVFRHNYQKQFIKLAIENEQSENKNPLLMLAKKAGPKLKEAMTESEIMTSDSWKGHESANEKINALLSQQPAAKVKPVQPSSSTARKLESPIMSGSQVLRVTVAPAPRITESPSPIIPIQQHSQLLPYEYLEDLDKNLKSADETIKSRTLELEIAIANKDDTLSASRQFQLRLAEASSAGIKAEIELTRNKFTNQIVDLVKSDKAWDIKQAMVIVSNFRALLGKTLVDEELRNFWNMLINSDEQFLGKLNNKLQEFALNYAKDASVQLLINLTSQLDMIVSTIHSGWEQGYLDYITTYKISYNDFANTMKASQELADYYVALDGPVEKKLAPGLLAASIASPRVSEGTSTPLLIPTPVDLRPLSTFTESDGSSAESTAETGSRPLSDELQLPLTPPMPSSEVQPSILDVQSQPPRVIALLDVDMTLVMAEGKYNDELINALIAQGITSLYLFTSYAVGGAGAGSPENVGSRNKLINYLKTKNIEVLGIIVEDDVLYKKGLGKWYSEQLQPLEQAAAAGTLTQEERMRVQDLEDELRTGISKEQYNSLSTDEQRNVQQRAHEKNSINKGHMFKYVVSQLGNQHTYVFIDDDFRYNIPKVREAATELGAKLITVPVTQGKKQDQFLDEINERRNWIKEAEQYRRVFNITPSRKKPEFKVVIKEGDLSVDQMMGYSTVYGSVFNSLTKTLWMVMNGGKQFHVPGEENVRTATQDNKALKDEVMRNPHLFNEDEFIYTQALNRYVVANVEHKKGENVTSTKSVYIAATAAPQLDDPGLWDYKLLIIDPVQNTEENINKLMQKAESFKKANDIFSQRLEFISKIPTYAEMLEKYHKFGKQSRYIPLKNKSGSFITRGSNGIYGAADEINSNTVFIDKRAYIATKVKELEAKMYGFDQWLRSQNKEGEWRALDAGVGAFAWLGGLGAITHAELLELHDEAYRIVLRNNTFKKIKTIQSKRNILADPTPNVTYKPLAEDMNFYDMDTDFSNCDPDRLMGIDACVDARTPLGNEKNPLSVEPTIINAAIGARAAGSPWTSPELLHPDNWIIEQLDGTRISGTEYLSGEKNLTVEKMREELDQRKPADIRELELWNKNREKIFGLVNKNDYGALNIILKQFSDHGRRQIIDVIIENLRRNVLMDKDKPLLIQDMKKLISALHAMNLKHSEKLQICEELFARIRDNKLPTGQEIYQSEKGDEPSLFADFLPQTGRPALLSKQIELIKQLKAAYVDIVADAVNTQKTQSERDAIQSKLDNKKGLVDFQNSNTPINISVTGTRKKLEQLPFMPQHTDADKELYKEITKLKIDDLNKIVDGILKAQEDNDFKTAAKYIQEYLGRRQYGILTRNFREDFIELAIEKGDFVYLNKKNNTIEPVSPLLRLVKNVGPELKKALIESEIMDSHFWKGHDSSKNYISEALFKGRLTLADFKAYRDKFADKKANELKMIQERKQELEGKINGIISVSVKDILLQLIGHIRIDFLESDEFSDFIKKFISPMVSGLNDVYKEKHQFPRDYSEFYHAFNRIIGFEAVADKGMFFNKRFNDDFNAAMARNTKLSQVEVYNLEIAEINVSGFAKRITDLEAEVLKTRDKAKYAKSEVEAEKSIFNEGYKEVERHHKNLRNLQKDLIALKNRLTTINDYLAETVLTEKDSSEVDQLFDKTNGVHAKVALIEGYLLRLDEIKGDHLKPLQKIYGVQKKSSFENALAKTLSQLQKSQPFK